MQANLPYLFNANSAHNPYQFNVNYSNNTAQIPLINQNYLMSQKLVKSGMAITTAHIPQEMKDSMIHLLFANPSSSFINMMKNKNQQTTRVLFKKEEDEKIKKLVKIFGTRHWDLVAQFMEGRTAKQCRDRYSNYLIPGFFQGEWTDNEDALLLKLYKEIGPRWSLIKKSFPNRSANNIKNRWYYFLHKKVQFPDNQIAFKNEKEFKKVEQKKKIETEMIVDPLKKVDGEMIKDTAKLVENLFDDSKNEFEDPFFQNGDCDIFIE